MLWLPAANRKSLGPPTLSLASTYQQGDRTNAPGAKYHTYRNCTQNHLIRPALWAFWAKAPPELQSYITRRLGTTWLSLDEYITWCTTSDRKNDLPNHLALFWCLMRYWDRFQ